MTIVTILMKSIPFYIKSFLFCTSLLCREIVKLVPFFFLCLSSSHFVIGLTKNRRSRTPTTKLRQCFTMQEVDRLEHVFEETIGYPDTKSRRKLATEMQVSESKIQVRIIFTMHRFKKQAIFVL